MQLKEAMAALEKAGTAQNRKVYPRHGIGGQMFGVSFSALDALAKSIKRDHALARELWASGNHDARVLAMKIADPAQATVRELETWAKDLDNYVITDAFSGYAAKTSFARALAAKWITAKGEWVGRAGWRLYAYFAMAEEPTPDAEFEALLAATVRDIHGSKNRVRDAMNMTLIAIGGRNPNLTAKALAAAKQIGGVEVDHGETGCKTPDAAGYIARMLAHKSKKAGGARKSTAARPAATARKAAKTTPKKKG